MTQGLLQDLRYGLRRLAKTPGFTAISVVTLALGIGANAAVFGLIESLYLARLPVADASRVVTASQIRAGQTGTHPLSYSDYLFARDNNRMFASLAAHYSGSPMNFVRDGRSRELNGSVVTKNFFDVLALSPAVGRFFRAEEDIVPGLRPVAVISYGLWSREFLRDPGVVGRPIRLNGTEFTVVGVGPEAFRGAELGGLATDVWIPSAMFRVGYRYCDAFNRDCNIVRLIGRLKPNVEIADAETDLNALAAQLSVAFPETNKGRSFALAPARGAAPSETPEATRIATLLSAAVGLVVLIVCANLAGLLLASNGARRQELAVRLAIGASRGRIVRQLLLESLLLSAAGGAAGLLVFRAANRLIYAFYSVNNEGQRVYFNMGLTPAVGWFALGLTLVTGFAFGFAPAVQASRSSLVPFLKEDRATPDAPRQRLREALIVVQTAISIVLLVAAGLIVRSVRSVYRGAGLDPRNVVLLRLRPALVAYSPKAAREFQEEAIRRLESVPGVVSASPAVYPPLPGFGGRIPAWKPGQEPAAPANALQLASNSVGPRYFETIGVPLISGRDFNSSDSSNTPSVAIVNETAAVRLWPNQPAVGNALVVGGQACRVVGVVKDAQFVSSGEAPIAFVYRDYWQQKDIDSEPIDSRTHVRVKGDPTAMLNALRREIAAIDPNVPVSEDRPLTEWLDYRFLPLRAANALLTSFAALALFLSALGLYGILAYSVVRRKREFGIRMTLGAQRSDVSRLVVLQGAGLVSAGIAIGLVGAVGAARALASFLYGVGTYDPIAMAAAPLTLAGAALLASYLPARRATRIDPLQALKGE